jgi:hypothetical protein
MQTILTLKSIEERLQVNNSLYAITWWSTLLKICSQGLDVSDVKNWPVWQTISFGGKAKDVKRTLGQQYTQKGLDRKLGKHWKYILEEKMCIVSGEHTAELMVLPIEMLGFKDWVSIEEVNKRVLEMKLLLLPSEVVFQIPLQITTNSESLIIAAEPFEILAGIKFFFALSEEIAPVFTELKFPPSSNVICAKLIS